MSSKKPLKRYNKRQIIINRIIVAAILALLLVGIVFGVKTLFFGKSSKPEAPPEEQQQEVQKDKSEPVKEDKSKEKDDIPSPEDTKTEAADTSEMIEPPSDKPKDEDAPSPSSGGIFAQTEPDTVANYNEKTLPMLVNKDNPIPKDFVPELEDIGNGYKFNKKALPALKSMIADAKKAGINLTVISAYRSTESQTRLYNNKVQEYKNLGYDDTEAVVQASAWVAVPGTSEHSTGLAVDLNSLEESFDTTATFKWLIENCANYGFILRFPKDKVSVTKISYEPWHYRYVGTNYAKEIMSKGICLEEYLAK
ncbi:MAG: M15 family metallopeptidase [Oscillospiraceae bacterium]